MADDTAADLTPYVPRLLLHWKDRFGSARHQRIDGTLVFADVSGFTRLSEALARKGGKVGAEEMADIINALFGELLLLAARRGGEMLKYGGDAMLLFFSGDEHAPRAAAAALEMQRRLKEIGRVETGNGVVRLRMSVGMHSGDFDFFVAGRSHRELIVAGPATTVTVDMEATADATEVLVSPATAALVPASCVRGHKGGGILLRRIPQAPLVHTEALTPHAEAADFLAPMVREHLASGAASPEHRLATVAFLQFLELDRVLDAGRFDEAAQRIDDTVSLVQDAFNQFGVSFLATDLAADGGKVMASAGAPITRGDDEERMLRAARRIIDEGPALPVRIGVNRGHVFAGDIGPSFRRTYTTLGDVTNTAARVMGKAKAGEVLTLQGTLDAATSHWINDRLDPFAAKGKRDLLVPFRVGERHERVERAAEELPLIGRAAELERLAGIAEQFQSGRGRFVHVVGEPGAGKTRVLNQLQNLVSDCLVSKVRCDPLGAGVPYQAIIELLRPVLGTEKSEVLAAVSTLAPEEEPLTPLLGIVFGFSIPATPATAELDPQFVPQQLSRLLSRLVRAACRRRPLLWCLDDAEHLDAASASMIGVIASQCTSGPLLIGVTSRSPDGPLTAPADSEVIELAALTDQAAREIVECLLPDALLPRQVAELVDRSGGNPLFLVELVRSMASPGTEVLPQTLETVMSARIDDLPTGARRVLRELAVGGTTIPPMLVTAVFAEVYEPELASPLQPFIAVEDDGSIAFRHTLIRDSAYEGLPFRRRIELHRAIGQHLEETADPHATAGVLAHHFLLARDFVRAWRYARSAGDQLKSTFAYVDAAVHYRRALQAGARINDVSPVELSEVWESLGHALLFAAEYGASDQAFQRARQLSRDEPIRLAALLQQSGLLAQRQGRLPLALRRFREGIRLVEGDTGREATEWRVRLLVASAAAHQLRGQFNKTIELAQQAATEAERVGFEGGLAHAHAALYTAYVSIGDRTGAERYRALPLEVMERVGALLPLGSFLTALGIAEHERSDWPAAVEWYERARDVAERAGDAHRQAVVANNLAEILSDQGRFEEAEALFLEAVAVWRPSRYRVGITMAEANLGRLQARRGNTKTGVDRMGRAAEEFSALGLDDYALLVSAWRLEAGVQAGGSPMQEIRAARRMAATRPGATAARLILTRLEATVLARIGETKSASELFAGALAEAETAEVGFEVAQTLVAWAGHPASHPPADAEQRAGRILRSLGVERPASLAPA